MTTNATAARYDVLIVGGGAAGLSAAVALARSRRSVLVVDAGDPRNAPAAGVHNLLTRDGIAPAELQAVGRAEARSFGAVVLDGEAVGAARDDDGFALRLADGGTVRGRRLLVTSGLVDELPAIPGLREQWGHGVVHCPYCHGWEVRDRAIGVLATGPMAAHQAGLFRQLSDDVTVFVHDRPPFAPDELEVFAARGIRVVQGPVAAVTSVDGSLTGLELADGTPYALGAVVVASVAVARSAVLAGLGLEAVPHPMGAAVGRLFESDASGATSVPGVWVAGNVTNLSAQVVTAAGDGLMAGAAINADLIAEETRAAVEAYRAG